MKITRIETRIHRSAFTYGVGLDSVGGTSRATSGNLALKTMDTLLVKVETDQGVRGWGEGFGFTLVDTTRDAIDRLIAPACIGQDARDIGALNRMLQKRFHNFGRNGPVTFGISAIDIALWDIAGKCAGKPCMHCWVMLGGIRFAPMPACCATAIRKMSRAMRLRLCGAGIVISSCTK